MRRRRCAKVLRSRQRSQSRLHARISCKKRWRTPSRSSHRHLHHLAHQPGHAQRLSHRFAQATLLSKDRNSNCCSVVRELCYLVETRGLQSNVSDWRTRIRTAGTFGAGGVLIQDGTVHGSRGPEDTRIRIGILYRTVPDPTRRLRLVAGRAGPGSGSGTRTGTGTGGTGGGTRVLLICCS